MVRILGSESNVAVWAQTVTQHEAGFGLEGILQSLVEQRFGCQGLRKREN